MQTKTYITDITVPCVLGAINALNIARHVARSRCAYFLYFGADMCGTFLTQVLNSGTICFAWMYPARMQSA